MVNDFINIEKDPKDKKNSFSISSNNGTIIDNSKNINLSKSLQLKPVSNNTIEAHGMQINYQLGLNQQANAIDKNKKTNEYIILLFLNIDE